MAALACIFGLLICAAVALAEGPQDALVRKWSGYRTARVGAKGEKRVDHSFTVKALELLWAFWLSPFGRGLYRTHSVFFDGVVGGILGGAIGGSVTVALAYLAWTQLASISRTAGSDFILRLKNDFFRPQTRRLMHLIDDEWLTFVDANDDTWHFAVKESAPLNSRRPSRSN
jgi:hypothetical protein